MLINTLVLIVLEEDWVKSYRTVYFYLTEMWEKSSLKIPNNFLPFELIRRKIYQEVGICPYESWWPFPFTYHRANIKPNNGCENSNFWFIVMMNFALKKCWEATHLWREEGKIILCMAKVDLICSNALNLKKPNKISYLCWTGSRNISSYNSFLSKTEELKTEDKQHINILFLFGIKFCPVFGNFIEILVSLKEAAQNWH